MPHRNCPLRPLKCRGIGLAEIEAVATLGRDWLSNTLKFFSRYFRLDVHGLENIPKFGPGIIVANHSGWMGLDALILAYVIKERTGRKCRIMAHLGYFNWSRRIRESEDAWQLRNGRFSFSRRSSNISPQAA